MDYDAISRYTITTMSFNFVHHKNCLSIAILVIIFDMLHHCQKVEKNKQRKEKNKDHRRKQYTSEGGEKKSRRRKERNRRMMRKGRTGYKE